AEASPATAAGTAAESAATIAAFAVLIARALRALTLLVAVAVLLAHRTDREIHPTLTVDLGDLHLHGVADVHDVLNAIDPFGRELRNADQAFLAGQVLDERADAHDPRDLAVVDLADLRLLGHSHDHRLGPLAAVGLRAGNADRSVVLELDRDARDHLADRNAGVHERERRTARRRHRRRAVRLERLAHDADRVRELLFRWKDGRDRSLRERAVADLAPACAAHHAHLADRIRG